MRLASGTRLGPYEILSSLGAGGMGEVYRARDTRLDRDVAIKVLPPHLASDPGALARFEREGKALAALSDANILAVHDVGRHGDISFIVEELLEGETLRSRLSHGPLPWKDAVAIAASIAEGVAAAHDRGIVHRDLKPENIFLTKDGVVKVLDFGLATAAAISTTDSTLASPTGDGMMLGTVGYMAPEQIRGRPVTPASDVFALGCVLHEMVAGRRPFGGTTQGELFAAILTQEPPPLPDHVPQDLTRLTARCLEKDPAKRRQSARDLAFDLRSVTSGLGPAPAAAPTARAAFRWWQKVGIAVGVVAVLAVVAWYNLRPVSPAADSVAVLPFVNTSSDRDSDYFADGLTDQLINVLSQIGSLQVLARSTVAKFAGPAVDPRDAGRQLAVGAIISGRVTVRGDDVRIAVELVDVGSGRQLWGDTYDRRMADVADVPATVSRAVADRLRLRTTDSEMARMMKRPTRSGPAYQAYLKGRFEINRRTVSALRRAVSFFEEAVEHDMSFAPAHAGLADARSLLVSFGDADAGEALLLAVASAKRALAIDPELGEAHAALAVASFFRFQWNDAERAFQRAIELSPQFATAHHWYSHYLIALGRWPESEAASRRAIELEPVNANIAAHLAWHYVYARQWDRAVEQCGRTIAIDPAYYQAFLFRGHAHAGAERFSEAIQDFEKALTLPGERLQVLGFLGYAYARGGQGQRAEETVKELMNLPRPFGKELMAALTYAGFGRRDEAIASLAMTVKARNPQAVNINVEPMFDSLRSDPRFPGLVRALGLEPK